MSGRWVTLREAAAILGVSLRTIQRKIKTGEVEAREGRGGREVLLNTPATGDEITRETLSLLEQQNERGIQIAATATGLAREQAQNYQLELQAARRGGRWAWCVIGVFLVAGGAGAWFINGALTRQETEIEATQRRADGLKGELEGARTSLSRREAEMEKLRSEIAAATAEVKAQTHLLEVLTTDRDKLRDDATAARGEAAGAKALLEAAKQRLTSLEAQLAAKTEPVTTQPGATTQPATMPATRPSAIAGGP